MNMLENPASEEIVVLGLGYVGLPLVRACVDNGMRVVGFDTNREVTETLQTGRSHVDDVSDADVARCLAQGLHVTSSSNDLPNAHTFIICVPTPLSETGGPDLGAVTAAALVVAEKLTRGSLVVLESTSYPGTTEEVLLPILESSGLKAGDDFSLAFSPERIDPGNEHFKFENTPKVVGGLSPTCLERAASFYERLVSVVVPTKGLKEAEMAKLLENTYRHLNIALANELARLCHAMDIDIWEVIRAAETKPYGFQAFRPGPGVGGHCIPIDPNYLSHRVKEKLGQPFRLVELAQEINSAMPSYVVQRVEELLDREGKAIAGSLIVLLGVTYKKDVADTRESPAYVVARMLLNRGAELSFHDPYVETWGLGIGQIERVGDWRNAAKNADCVILLQGHSEYLVEGEILETVRLLDTRGVVQSPAVDRL